ncbi:MAG: alpha/beta fold hydrolase [Burkholderiaceae bacterium]
MTPIVLVPGLLATADVFAPQLDALWPHGPVTFASTLAGTSLPEMAAALLASAPPRFALAGWSLGGFIALEVMRQAPARVLRLALLDTSARPDTPEESAQRREWVARARQGEFEAMQPRAVRMLLHPDRRADHALVDRLVRMGRTVGVDGFARQTAAVVGRPDARPQLRAIGVPTLVLVGERDELTPPVHARELAEGIPGARLVVVPDAGHATTLEQPEAVSRALVDWIGG